MASNLFRTPGGFSIDGKTNIFRGSVDPTVTATAAPLSSLYFRENGATVETYQKTSAPDTGWTKFSMGGAGTEDGFQNTFIGKTGNGSVATSYSSATVLTQGDSLLASIGKLDAKVGTATVPVARTFKPIVGTNAIHRNIELLDQAIGLTPTSTNYIATGATVNANLSTLDARAKTNADAIGVLQNGIRWITAMVFITADNLTARSGLAVFTDDTGATIAPVVGNRVVSTFDNKIYVAASGAWGAGTALVTNDTFFVGNDLLTTDPTDEKTAAYSYNGSACIQTGSFDFEAADSIAIIAGYTPGTGTVAASDTVQSAIQKVDGNVRQGLTASGLTLGLAHAGTWTGAGASRLLTPNAETLKSAIEKTANDIGAVAGGAGDYASAQSVNANINALDAALTKLNHQATIGSVTTDTLTTIDTVALNAVSSVVEYDVVLQQSSTPANRYVTKIRMIASANGMDFTEYAILTIGSAFSNVSFTVDSSTLSAVAIKVTATCVGGYQVIVTRQIK